MSTIDDKCQFCNKEKFKYTCPRCNVAYCSVECYKTASHLRCSEEFYKNCIEDHLTTAEPKSREDVHKIYEILKRIRETDTGLNPDSFQDNFVDPLDSDDDEPDEGEGTDGDEDDLATRLKGVDINNSDKVWKCLTPNERMEFENLVESQDIINLLPHYKPWWTKRRKVNSKIVELVITEEDIRDRGAIPAISQNIPEFSAICKKPPSPCLHYNLWNIFTAYACTVRFFAGEHLETPNDAAAHLVNLSTTLKYGTNFEDVEDAILSVEMETLTTKQGLTVPTEAKGTTHLEGRVQLQQDAQQMMSSQHFKLAALSDIMQLMQLARKRLKSQQSGESELQKLFAMCVSGVELNSRKLQQFIKKIDFLLSYVNREN